MNFEYYVLNENRTSKNIGYYNIFNNIRVNEETNKLCKDYKRKKMTFDEFVKELDGIIMWQEWSRCEYEILVGRLMCKPGTEELEKIDCYYQAHANIRLIAKYVLEEYYPRLKIKLSENEQKEG